MSVFTTGAWRPPAICGLLAVVTALAAEWASHFPRWNLDLLLDISPQRPVSALVTSMDPSFTLSAPGESYDGPFYWAIAVDPLARGRAHTLIDLPGYRYGHPLYAWTAKLLSLGHVTWLPVAFWLLGLASMAWAGWQCSRLAAENGASPWWGCVVATSPGLLFSASSDLTEPFQLALVVTALRCWQRRRTGRNPVSFSLVLIAACMSKEQLVLLPCCLAIDLLFTHLHSKTKFQFLDLVPLALGPAALFAWRHYLGLVMTPEQMAYQAGNVGAPFAQLPDILRMAAALRQDDTIGAQVGSTAPAMLVAVGVVLMLGSVAGLRRGDALGMLVTAQTVLISCLGWRTLLFPHETLRIPSVSLILALLSLGVGLRRRTDRSDGRSLSGRGESKGQPSTSPST